MSPQDFISKFSTANIQDDEVFSQLVREGTASLQITDREVAQEFSAALPTIARWKDGIAAPHSVLRPAIRDWFLIQAKESK